MHTYTVYTSFRCDGFIHLRDAYTSAGGGEDVVGYRAALAKARERLATASAVVREMSVARDGRVVRVLTR